MLLDPVGKLICSFASVGDSNDPLPGQAIMQSACCYDGTHKGIIRHILNVFECLHLKRKTLTRTTGLRRYACYALHDFQPQQVPTQTVLGESGSPDFNDIM